MKTIKFMGLAALSLLILITSCDEEVIETNQDKKISFGMAVGKQTVSKATEFTYWTNGQSFPVEAYATGGTSTTPFASFTLTNNGGTNWTVAPETNQPGYSLTYYAWYPTTTVTALSSGSTGASASFDLYTVPAAASQVDLIAATSTTEDATVALQFHHLFSQVNFALQGIENVKISVSNIKVNSILASGTYTFGTTGTAGSWALEATTDDYTYTPIDGVIPTTGLNTNTVYLGNGGGTNTQTNALMLMPQDFAVNTSANISFDYALTDMADKPLASGSTLAYLSDFTTDEWTMGKRYLYLIDFQNYLQGGTINFTVTVTPWADGEVSVNTVAQTLEVAKPNKTSIEGAVTTHNTSKGLDANLKVFPISLGQAPDAAITLKDFTADKFEDGDKINIYCKTTAGAAFIALDPSLTTAWTLSVNESVVTLTKGVTP